MAPLLLMLGCPQDQLAAPGQAARETTAPSLSPANTPAPANPAPGAAKAKANSTATSIAPADPAGAPQQPSAEVVAHNARVQQLILQAERTYSSGVTNYRSGHLEAARNDFDAAVDVMLLSGMDVKNDPQLSEELDHLLNAVNSLEMAALKQGTGFNAPPEAAPLDAADEVTFAPNTALTAKVTTELKTTQSDLPLVVNDYVTGFINYFTNSPSGHAHLVRSLERSGKYRDMIQKDLQAAGLPQDLIYLAVAESGFETQVVNAHSGAGGMWQFMPFQGAYGLERNGYFDERFDPEKSSLAYARYMKSLYNQFGDWYLAMAAYNWGPGNVQRSVMRTGYADFWELYRRNVLPSATKNYVPGIIAVAIMAKNPAQYGLDKLVPMPPALSDTVQTQSAIDLRLVADVTGVSAGEIVALNPSLLRPTTPRDMNFDLHIPPGTRDLFTERLKEIPEEKRTSWRFHVVRSGESLEQIASTMHARTADLVQANGLAAGDSVAAGDELVIPLITSSASAAHPQRYTAARGDTLITVADRFNVSVEELRRWNHLSAGSLRPGRTLLVAEPLHLAPTGRARSRASRTRAAYAARGSSRRSTTGTHGTRTSRSVSAHTGKASASGGARRSARTYR